MKNLIIDVIEKDGNGVSTHTIDFEGKTKEELFQLKDEIFSNISFSKWYYTTYYDDLETYVTDDEESILDELCLLPDDIM